MTRILKSLARNRIVNSKQVSDDKVVQIAFMYSGQHYPVILGWFNTKEELVANVDLEYPHRSVVSRDTWSNTDTINQGLTVFANNEVINIKFTPAWVQEMYDDYKKIPMMQTYHIDPSSAWNGSILVAALPAAQTGPAPPQNMPRSGVVRRSEEDSLYLDTQDMSHLAGPDQSQIDRLSSVLGVEDLSIRARLEDAETVVTPEDEALVFASPLRGVGRIDLGIYVGLPVMGGSTVEHLCTLDPGLLTNSEYHDEVVYPISTRDTEIGYVQFRVPGNGIGSTIVQVSIEETTTRIVLRYNYVGISFTPMYGTTGTMWCHHPWSATIRALFGNQRLS